MVDVFDCGVEVVDDFDCEYWCQIFGVLVFFCCVDEWVDVFVGEYCVCGCVDVQFDLFVVIQFVEWWQQFCCDVVCDEQCFYCVVGVVVVCFCVVVDGQCFVEIGVIVDVYVVDVVEMFDYWYVCFVDQLFDQVFVVVWYDYVDVFGYCDQFVDCCVIGCCDDLYCVLWEVCCFEFFVDQFCECCI